MAAPATLTPNDALIDDALTFVQGTAEFVKRAMEEIGVHQSQQKKAAVLADPLFKKLKNAGMLTRPETEKAAAAMLGDHPGTLSLLDSLADKYIALRDSTTHTKAASLGAGEDPKKAGVALVAGGPSNSLTSPFVGRRTGEKTASDQTLFQILEPPQR